MRWTQDEIDLLKEKYATSTADELIEMFPNRSYHAISNEAYILRLNKDKSKSENRSSPHKYKSPRSRYAQSAQDEEIVRLYIDENLAMWKVAETLGISVGKVFNRLHFIGVKPKSQKDYPQSEEAVQRARELGKSKKGIPVSDQTKLKIAEANFTGGIGHKKIREDGYIAVYFPEHPMASADGYIMEHDLIMSCYIGRHLADDEVVHHKNHIRDDNRLCNLQLLTKSEHAALHMKERQEIKKRLKENVL